MPQGWDRPVQNTRPTPSRLRQDLGYVPARAPSSGGSNGAGNSGSGILISGGNNPVISSSRVQVKTVTGVAYTLVDADLYQFINFTNASPVAITIPTDATLATTLNTIVPVVAFHQGGAGQLVISGAGGVTINTLSTFQKKSVAQFAVLQLIWTAANTWTLFGAQST